MRWLAEEICGLRSGKSYLELGEIYMTWYSFMAFLKTNIVLLEGNLANVYKINNKVRKLYFSLCMFQTSYLEKRKRLVKPLNCSLCTFFHNKKAVRYLAWHSFVNRYFLSIYFKKCDYKQKRVDGWILTYRCSTYIPLLRQSFVISIWLSHPVKLFLLLSLT